MLRALGFTEQALGALTVGQRDALLMDLRANTLGTDVQSIGTCPACGERLDINFRLHDIWSAPSADPAGPVRIEHDDYVVLARAPNLDDLRWLEDGDTDVDARAALLERCLVNASRGDEPVAPSELPDEVVSHISGALAEVDPQADVQLALTCAECGNAWTALFDIVAFFWQELETWVRRMARDVDALAGRYGWREADILAMSPDRRALYLEVARA